MLTSLALIFLCGLLLGGLMKKLGLPDLLGMLITGIILGPYALNLLAPSILQLSADLRQIALVIILLRAGLSLDLEALKKVGRPALLMCFVPATLELLGTLIIAPTLLGISLLDAAILGTVLAAVSPAVIVPRMVNLIEEQRGTHHSIPQLIMAGASVDDIFVIVLFTSFTGIAEGGQFSIESFLGIPLAILLGIVVGLVVGLLLTKCFKSMHLRDSIKVIIILSIAFLLVSLESTIKATIPFSGLIAIMTLGATLYRNYCPLASRLSNKFSKLWIAAQLILFVLVGATVDLSYALKSTIPALLVISFALVFRALGVWLALLKTPLTKQERIFCIVAYMPKATVQAAIGSIPLTMGLSCGPIVLTISVIAIVLTAPLGAFGIDYLSHRLLPIE
ncbi:cation:proton antiporter [Niameybacter massiliensis]|uniref:Cation:proton antiporter n=1 Tax=Holtiella tumoricola TaxID=3018743 RepID=A0AA42DJM7_9FIRM|nr:cation:proton antiporter [Holtiella tumoricola]